MESPSVHRSAASPSSQMSRSSIHPSFSPIRIAASSSSSATLGASSSSGTAPPIPTGSAMTMEAAMASHLGMPNPVHSALETILSERNQLSSQNAQLWKLIEKQRSAYSRMLKDLERIRNERDSYKARLQTSAPPDIKSLKGSVSSSHMHSHSYEKERPSMESQASGSSHSNLNPRMGIVRHQSDDPGVYLCSTGTPLTDSITLQSRRARLLYLTNHTASQIQSRHLVHMNLAERKGSAATTSSQ